MHFRFIASLALAVLGGSAFADVIVPVITTTADFEAHKATLTKELDSDKYSEITPADKATVLQALGRIENHMRNVTSSDQLNETDRVDVLNDQEIINTITAHAAEDSRVVCSRSMRTGSHRITTNCMTVAERKKREKEAQDSMQGANSNAPGAGGG